MTDFIHGIDNAEEILIEDCCRCIGLLIFWKKRENCPKHIFTTQYAISGFHIPPKSGDPKRSRRQFFRILNDFNQFFELKEVFYCGGKINNKINQRHYELSRRYFIEPLKHLFPNCNMFGMDPTPIQHSSSMYMNEFLEVTFERFEYATNS